MLWKRHIFAARLLSVILPMVFLSFPEAAAQEIHPDSTDVFYKHLELEETVVTGLAGDTKMKEMPAPVSVVRPADLAARAGGNIISAIAAEPGVSEITTGGGISKPVIRGMGFNRVVVVSDGLRQEGQQWGDEHGIEVDGAGVHSVEILKGPASLMYASGLRGKSAEPSLPNIRRTTASRPIPWPRTATWGAGSGTAVSRTSMSMPTGMPPTGRWPTPAIASGLSRPCWAGTPPGAIRGFVSVISI